jgi:hypothetical protein
MGNQDLEARVQNIEDTLAIDRLEKIYGYYLDNRKIEDSIDLFSDNCESIEIADRGVFKGKDGVRRFFTGFMGKGTNILDLPGAMGFHMMHQGVVTVNPDAKTAKGRWYIVMILAVPIEEGGPIKSVLAHGVYENDFVKEDGVWKFMKMFMSLHYRSPIEGGWAVTPMVGEGTSPQADAPPTAYHPYPHIQRVPFHFKNPVTGK